MKRSWKLWTVVGVVILAGLLLGGAYVLSNRAQAQMQMQPPKATSDEALLRIAAALERIAAAMEKSASPGMMGGMMGMGMMGNMMGVMGNMMDMMGRMMSGMMGQMTGPQQMQEMMRACQQMMAGMMGQAPSQPSEAALTRTTEGAGITVKAIFMNPLLKPEEAAGKLVFKLVLDTHAGDLLQYDLTKLAVLRTSEELTVDKGFVWEPISESSHHRLGLLKVDATFEGKPLIAEGTKYIELELKEVGIPSRIFKWEEAFLGKTKP